MIRIFLGNVGSGNTISAVREIFDAQDNPNALPIFSNIVTKTKGKYALKKNTCITREMIVEKTLVKTTKPGEEVFKLKFNKEFWLEQKDKYVGFNGGLDEFLTLMDSRRFMSKQSRVLNDMLSLIRKICNNPNSDSTLTIISQLVGRIDVNARELATEIRYHIGLWDKKCLKCGAYWTEHSDLPDFQKHRNCPNCGSYQLEKFDSRIIVHFFANVREFELWYYQRSPTILQTIRINNIEKYFPYYDTFQLTNLISED